MIKIIASQKGQGKTKQLIALANEAVNRTDGHLVFIDDDKRHMFDLHHDIRFVDTTSFPLSNYRELVGFICGILSQNSDIKEIFLDGVGNIVKNFDNDALLKLLKKLEMLSGLNSVDFIFTINSDPDNLPEEAKGYLV
ncbi:MAG: twitching motility protein PilT [Clostridiales bacterium]|jgi:hypothetical protein|nr:twitching motility protein PilT [Clostridiales bacterium]